MSKSTLIKLGLISMMALITACSTTPDSNSDQAALVSKSITTMTQFRNSDPGIAGQMAAAYGMAIFPEIYKGAVGVGGAGGRGVVYEQGKMIGYTTMSQGTIGLQLGGQAYSQMILFESRDSLGKFTGSGWAFSANATAVAAASGAAAVAKYREGVMVYVLNMEGLMGEASVGGQKFNYERN